MKTTENFANVFAALVKFQGLMKNPPKTKEAQVPLKNGKMFTYKYADLSVIMDAIREPLKESGLAVIQTPVNSENGELEGVQTILIHESGEAIYFDPVYIKPPAGASPQQIGSVITYARRYSLCMALGIAADEDDDANAVEQDKQQSKIPVKRIGPEHWIPDEEQAPQKQKRTVDPERQKLLQNFVQAVNDWQDGITPDMRKRIEEEKELEERMKKGRKQIAIAAKEKGLTDEERHLVIEYATGKTSSMELNLEELRYVYKMIKNESAEDLKEIAQAVKYKKLDEEMEERARQFEEEALGETDEQEEETA